MTDYVELHARSAFSFLRGAATPEELISVCSEYRMPAMALVDNDGVYGAARFYLAVRKLKSKAHIEEEITVSRCETQRDSRCQIPNSRSETQRSGSEIQTHTARTNSNLQIPNPRCFVVPLLVRNRTGYQNLCRLITLMKL